MEKDELHHKVLDRRIRGVHVNVCISDYLVELNSLLRRRSVKLFGEPWKFVKSKYLVHNILAFLGKFWF